MLREVYLDALKTREQKISKVKDSDYQTILAETSSRWVEYSPRPLSCRSAGVDSSWNKRAYQGLSLYVIDAVSVSASNEILASEFEHDIVDSARNDSLASKAMAMEASVTQKVSDNGRADVICVDGSIIARLNKTDPSAAVKVAAKYGNSIFVAKSSDSRTQFASIGSKAGDMYYYNHATRSLAGFSVPAEIRTPYGMISEIYARLRDNTPMIRIEVLCKIGEREVKGILDQLSHRSVSGYPYCLRLAHNACKISNEDIERIARILDLQNEHGAREVLNE